MGVRRSDYIVVGANIGYDKYDDDKWDELYEDYNEKEEVGEITYLIDGYSGKYFIVGEILQVDTDDENMGLNFDFSDLSKRGFDIIKDRVEKFIFDKFGLDIETTIIVKTHWT